ncbi:MAG: glycosyltransferase family 4 protein, partial [bacterium]|nr:glycosyltransferase family 4 protein [bacterium]
MKILIVAYYYPPINSGGTMRPVKMAKYLPRMGHEVTVLTQTYGKSKIETGNGKPRIIRFHDFSHNRNRVGLRRKVQWFKLRMFTELLNMMGIYHSIYSWWKRKVIRNSETIINLVQPDVIIATYPPVETLEIGVYLSKKYNIPLISDFRDGLIFEPIETKRMKQYPCIRE